MAWPIRQSGGVPLLVAEFAERSDAGRDPHKRINEDACGSAATRLGHLAVTCDGMGGHEFGQQASRVAVSTILKSVSEGDPNRAAEAVLREALERANAAVFALGGPGAGASRPGSTCVCILVHPGGTEVAHVGDSRVLVVRDGQIWPLTRDHSLVQQLVDRGELSPEQAKVHPDANVITRALGMASEVAVEVRQPSFPHRAGDVFLLATDGLSDVVTEAEMLAAVQHATTLDAAGMGLVDLANQRGGPDNITVQLVRVASNGGPSGGSATLIDKPATTLLDARSDGGTARRRPEESVRSSAAPTLVEAESTLVGPASGARFWPHPARDETKSHLEKAQRQAQLLLLAGVGLVALILAAVITWWALSGRAEPPSPEVSTASPNQCDIAS